jgi:hypothetical protein
VFNNTGLCGDPVSVGSLGSIGGLYDCWKLGVMVTNGCDGKDGTALGTACPSPSSSPPPSVNTMASDVNGVVTHTGTVGLLVGALAATLFALPLLI